MDEFTNNGMNNGAQPQYDQAQQYGAQQPQYGQAPQYGAQQPQYGQAPQYGAQQPQYGQAPQYGAQPQYGMDRLPSGSKEKVAAGLLAIFLGTLGIHKFYLGYTKAGVIMLLVSLLTFGVGATVMAIIALIEGIMYLTKSDQDFDTIYVRGTKEWF